MTTWLTFHNAGGITALFQKLDALTITGETLGEALDADIFRPFSFLYSDYTAVDRTRYTHAQASLYCTAISRQTGPS